MLAESHVSRGLSAGWIVAALVVIVVVGIILFKLFANSGPRQLTEEEQLEHDRQILSDRVRDLYEHECKDMCLWMIAQSREYVNMVTAALEARTAQASTPERDSEASDG
jgi:uncharacterized membrane-anchored protein YhcB (DUF1043 family)